MKINTLKNAAIMLFVASLALVSCSDDSDPTPVQPTIVSAGTLPSEVGIGNSVDISFDIGPREVNIVDVTVTETIAGADGSAKGTNELGSIGGNIGLNTYTYT